MEKNPNLIIKYDDVVAHWMEDSKEISLDHPDKDASKLNNLHAKYVTIKHNHALMVKRIKAKYNKEKRFRWRYYRGDVGDKEELRSHKVEQFDQNILKSDVPLFLESDSRLNELQLKMEYHQNIVDYTTEVLKALHDKTFLIKHIIDWARMETGG